jgi:hypothetical protein
MTNTDSTTLSSIQEDLDRLVNDLSIHFDIGNINFEDSEDYEKLHNLRTQLERYVLEDFYVVNKRLMELVYSIESEQAKTS